MNDLVSVIMPVYNAEAFVVEAIDSVLAQTYPRWELIIVDDGSTDASPEVLNRYTDPRIVTIRQHNKGEGGARNTGLDRARGEYISFLDADDVYLPTALADLVGYLRQHDEVDVVYADGYYCDEMLRPLRRLSECRPGTYEGMILEPLLLSSFFLQICMALRKTAIEAGHVRFDESLRYGVDWDFWIQLARRARYGNLPKAVGLYRLHPNSMTWSATQSVLNEKLVPGRLKAMNAAWFAELSVPTRQQFFYGLLIDLLGDLQERQQAIMDAAPFLALPAGVQAELLRLVASHHLRSRRNTEFALDCLRQSLNLQPGNDKSRILLLLGSHSPTLAAACLSIWRIAHRAAVGVRSFDQRKPKPVPMVMSRDSAQ